MIEIPSPPLSLSLPLSQNSSEDEPVEHGVAIVADTDSWTCKLLIASKDTQTK